MRQDTKKTLGYFLELNGLGCGGALMGNAWGLRALLIVTAATTVAVVAGEAMVRRERRHG